MLYVVVKTLPNGQKPGEILDVPEVIGRVLVSAGAVRLANISEDQETKPSRRVGYRRKDRQAGPSA